MVSAVGRVALIWLIAGPALAQEVFTPPQAYPVERYQQGWKKNPFVLKTAPVISEPVSFARDWVIAGCFGTDENPSVIVMNTKTRERVRLKKGEPASNGMSLNSVTFKASSKDTVAEVASGNSMAVLRYDESHLKQPKAKVPSKRPSSSRVAETAPASTSAPNSEPVASMPSDEGSGFPYTYGKDAAGGTVASVDDTSPSQGRRRLLTSQKPVGGGAR